MYYYKSFPLHQVLPCQRVYLVNDVDRNLLEEFADIFGDIGCLPGEYKLKSIGL